MSPPPLPNDVIQHVLANLPVKQIYLLRGVNRDWYSIHEHAIKQHLSFSDSKVLVRLGPSSKAKDPKFSIALDCVAFDPEARIFTFKPIANSKPIYCNPLHLRQVKILYSEWIGIDAKRHNGIDASLNSTNSTSRNYDPSPQEIYRYARIKFHHNYVEAVQKYYYLEETPGIGEEISTYLGDYDMILKCHLKDSVVLSEEDISDVEYFDNLSHISSFNVDFLQVHTSWLISGTTTRILPTNFHSKIYPSRYALLNHIISQKDIQKYNLYSPKVIRWILSDYMVDDQQTIQLCQHLNETKGDFTIRDKFQWELDAKNIKKQIMWKYSFVARFFCDPENSSDTFEQILDRFVRAEYDEKAKGNVQIYK
ncbi:18308_t:CDS:1 [Dentiscutata erythropus]|uniref:18308_t:CDS:1 n=1 Tax=Dentiscutata erythropus TaxID=1348616 RepID=A0A9N9G2L3_9GLOM|nr:18308_t:CDS:1 [Dentiscutata erythropus]